MRYIITQIKNHIQEQKKQQYSIYKNMVNFHTKIIQVKKYIYIF